jgi:hypothetical protein
LAFKALHSALSVVAGVRLRFLGREREVYTHTHTHTLSLSLSHYLQAPWPLAFLLVIFVFCASVPEARSIIFVPDTLCY